MTRALPSLPVVHRPRDLFGEAHVGRHDSNQSPDHGEVLGRHMVSASIPRSAVVIDTETDSRYAELPSALTESYFTFPEKANAGCTETGSVTTKSWGLGTWLAGTASQVPIRRLPTWIVRQRALAYGLETGPSASPARMLPSPESPRQCRTLTGALSMASVVDFTPSTDAHLSLLIV